jgi:hypothetical protein
MRRNIPTFSAILLLSLLVLSSACVSSGNGNAAAGAGIDAGLSQAETQELSRYISFEEAQQEFENYSRAGGSDEKLPVYYLISRDLDRSGNASSWLFGVHQDAGTVLLMYDRSGWKINPWNATLPSEEIVMNRVVPPGTLFSRNKGVIFNTSSPSGPESRDLVLKQGVYTLTIRSGSSSRTLMFDATTGGLMSG